MNSKQLKELLLQALRHERGGVLVYQTALQCALNKDLRKEWTEYLAQTERHVDLLTGVCAELGIDAGEITPGCKVVEHVGEALVVCMKMALAEGNAEAAELVACDAVVLAETKDHANWGLIGECARAGGDAAKTLLAAYDEVEDQEDEHLYHTQGWSRELWLKSLGLKAKLPPPEERDDVKSATAAAAAKKRR